MPAGTPSMSVDIEWIDSQQLEEEGAEARVWRAWTGSSCRAALATAASRA